MNIEKIAKAIEDDAGEALPGLRESLAEMKAGEVGRKYTPDQLLLISARKAANVSQPRFAELLETSTGTYRDWEQGRHGVPGAVKVLAELILRMPDTILPQLTRKQEIIK